MATIKSYSDLQQSKKLAEILPLESADMFYKAGNDAQPTFRLLSYGHIMSNKDVCAWSLAALLGVLPSHFYDKTERKALGMDKGDTYFNIFYENKNSYIQKSADNPVDACVAMIDKLHELKLI